jgi:tetratricopeptide (TPR) repeat protein
MAKVNATAALQGATRIGLRAAGALMALAVPALHAFAQEPQQEPDVRPPTFTLPDGYEQRAPGQDQPPAQRPPAPDIAPGPHRPGPQAQIPKSEVLPTTPEQRAKRLDELYAKLAAAPDQEIAAPIAEAIDQVLQHSSSPTAELLVLRAVNVAQGNRDLAMKLLDAAVELQPDYAEAWNRRAFVYYLNDDYKRALGDIRRVLALEPRHYKALEGLGQILRSVGEKKGALAAYDSLLAIYPTMPGAKEARDELKVEVEGQGI